MQMAKVEKNKRNEITKKNHMEKLNNETSN